MDSDPTEQPEHRALRSEVEQSLAEAGHGARFAAASALARHYAELLDHAAPDRAYVKALRLLQPAMERYADDLDPPAVREFLEAWERVSTALAEHSVASDLGPKLLAALDKLGLTLAASKSAPAPPPAPEQAGQDSAAVLHLLRGQADERNGVA